MYKVFIENRPVIFSTVKPAGFDGIVYDAGLIDKIDSKLLIEWNLLQKNQSIFVVCQQMQNDFRRLFADFEFIHAAGGIVKRNATLLFIKRNGFWDIPKGKLEQDENPEEGALREIEEECGISGMSIHHTLIKTYHTYYYFGKPTLKETTWYAVNYNGPEKTITQSEEGITEAVWFSINELDTVKNNTFASILDVIEAYEKLDFNSMN
jgi:8-oxo-dGTP pyrophosphatase MutT (NUDIX family)